MNLRAIAAQVIGELLQEHGSLSSALDGLDLPERDHAWLQALCFEVMRHYPSLDAMIRPLLQKPLKPRDQDIHALLLIGACQLRYMRVAEHAALNETVQACTELHKGWAKGLVNAVLRQFQRRAPELEQALSPAARGDHPEWLWQSIRRDWSARADRILAANNAHPPMMLRVNRQRTTRTAYGEQLATAGIASHPCIHAPDGLWLEQPVAVAALPGFADGLASVQDESAQLAATLLPAKPGLRVLDACAAPGGKTSHWLEIEPRLQLTALDVDDRRLARVHDNLQRLGLTATVISGDLGCPVAWWEGNPFDAILLDAPCSGTGVIRRHPDIKLLRKRSTITALAHEQQHLLATAWSLLAPGGVLLYSTCSILLEENTHQIAQFLQATANARELPIEAAWGQACTHGRQILPDAGGGDGFYYARLQKTKP